MTRPYHDLHQHIAILRERDLLIEVDIPIDKDSEMHPLVRWQFQGGMKESERKAFLFTNIHDGHIRLMAEATQNGAIIMPPVPGFYTRPETIDDIVTQSVGRALDLFDFDLDLVKRWTGKSSNDLVMIHLICQKTDF